MSGNTCYFVIVGHNDNPVYELDVKSGGADKQEDKKHLNQFIAHAALDLVDESKWKTTNPYLQKVDRFNDYYIAAFVTASHMRFLLLYDTLSRGGEDSIKSFFMDMYELYTKASLNPFYELNTKLTVTSKHFDAKAQQIAKKHLL